MSGAVVLLLAGTAEAREFAGRCNTNIRVIASLAGVTGKPLAYPCEVIQGGFGGADGLAAYLQTEKITALVDATHPFATKISANATTACEMTQTPLLRLIRPAWEGEWTACDSLNAALNNLPANAKVFATPGQGAAQTLATRPDVHFIMRSIETLVDPPANVTTITARPPFRLDDEIALMRAHKVTHLLLRNSGGSARARLDAARALDLPILMIGRPALPAANSVSTVESALSWLGAVLGD